MGELGFTYPPFSAVIMWPMSYLPWQAVQTITDILVGLACAAFCYCILRDSVRMRGPQGLLIVGLATAAAFLWEPIRENVSFGQVNLFLAMFIAGDFLFVAKRWPKFFGIGIGLAAAIKLTPAIFVLYLLITKRWQPALVAVASFAVFSFGVAVVAPHEVWDFFSRIVWDTSRVGAPDNVFNQSINGMIARFASPNPPSRAIWAPLALLVLVFGMWRARRLFLAGDDMAGMTVTGIVALMITPISWTHHAVWVLPATVVLVHRAWELGRDYPTLSSRERRSYWVALGLAVASLGWWVESHHYLTDQTHQWWVGSGTDLLLAMLPTLWCLAVVVLLPARRVLPAWRDPVALAAATKVA